MYFRSDRPGGSGPTDLWVTTRATTSDPWGTPVLATGLDSKSTELTPEISLDGLTIWFSTNRAGSQSVGSFDIWVSTRASRGAAWSAPTDVTEVNSSAVDFAGTPFPDFLTMMLTSQRAGGLGGDDIFMATRPDTTSPWGTPVFVPELSTTADDSGAYPVDPNDIYLSSKITGDQELFVSRRASTGVPFGAPVHIPELGSPASDEAPWVSADERYVVFSSDRSGIYQIYESTR
jgi:Tol biopolymer transport system component